MPVGALGEWARKNTERVKAARREVRRDSRLKTLALQGFAGGVKRSRFLRLHLHSGPQTGFRSASISDPIGPTLLSMAQAALFAAIGHRTRAAVLRRRKADFAPRHLPLEGAVFGGATGFGLASFDLG